MIPGSRRRRDTERYMKVQDQTSYSMGSNKTLARVAYHIGAIEPWLAASDQMESPRFQVQCRYWAALNLLNAAIYSSALTGKGSKVLRAQIEPALESAVVLLAGISYGRQQPNGSALADLEQAKEMYAAVLADPTICLGFLMDPEDLPDPVKIDMARGENLAHQLQGQIRFLQGEIEPLGNSQEL